MPEFKPRAIELGLFFKELSAEALHMAHCAKISVCDTSTNAKISKIIKYFLLNFNTTNLPYFGLMDYDK